ncbi:hypothetical protein O3P69_016489 [Scylla paramamosain]|uniref:Uncharacterized protein n=1 Tax=Scylla paramamosain TaxID=85552 RepID=A0AAW0TE84_SCYPA
MRWLKRLPGAWSIRSCRHHAGVWNIVSALEAGLSLVRLPMASRNPGRRQAAGWPPLSGLHPPQPPPPLPPPPPPPSSSSFCRLSSWVSWTTWAAVLCMTVIHHKN